MKGILLTVFLTLFISVYALQGTQERYVEQPLNHYNDMVTFWEQRYFVNEDYFLSGGPIFIYIGKGFETFDLMSQGEMFDLNKQLNGYLFALEHRFYGSSRPTRDVSARGLDHLSIEQALADIAQFIQYIREAYPNTKASKIILFGEGYGAALAVWARQKYPHLISGVWASSAYVSPTINHDSLAENVGQIFKRIGGQKCYNVVNRTFEELDLLIWMEETEKIKNDFKQCKELIPKDPEDVASLYINLLLLLKDFLQQSSYADVEKACETLTKKANNAYESFSTWLTKDAYPNVDCWNFNIQDTIDMASQVTWESVGTVGGARQDAWLQCSQLGQFPTSDSANQPFGDRFPLQVHLSICAKIFPQANLFRANKKVLLTYGDKDLSVSNVFFTNGEFDPQNGLGVMNGDSNVVVIPLQSKGKDLRKTSGGDYPELSEVKMRAKVNILKWIFDLKF